MLISERIFKKLEELHMTQKEFSEKTGIRQSTISEWKKKKTNPSADKIMVICKALGVDPNWLLSGSTVKGKRRNQVDWYIIEKNSELGLLVESYNRMEAGQRERIRGYIEAIENK